MTDKNRTITDKRRAVTNKSEKTSCVCRFPKNRESFGKMWKAECNGNEKWEMESVRIAVKSMKAIRYTSAKIAAECFAAAAENAEEPVWLV